MCLSNGPAVLTKTRILVHDTTMPDGTPVRVLAYQNSAENHDSGPNAMIFFVPSAAPLTERNFIPEALEYKGALKQMEEQLSPRNRGGLFLLGMNMRGAEKFDYGKYEVVAGRPVDAFDLAATVSFAKRPNLQPWFREFLAAVDPGLSVVIACFDSREMFEADPIFLAYLPTDETNYHIPMFDGHDGKMPNPEADVRRDHFVIFGSPGGRQMEYLNEVKWDPSGRPWFLPRCAVGMKIEMHGPNGDMIVPAATVATIDVSSQWRILDRLTTISPLQK